MKSRNPISRFILHGAILLVSGGFAHAGLKLPHIIPDNMLLQRDKPVCIRGWSKPGAIVTVRFAGQEKVAAADSAGEWLATLSPIPASIPASLIPNPNPENRRVAIEGSDKLRIKSLVVNALELIRP